MHAHAHTVPCASSAAAGRRMGLALLLSLATACGELWGARHSGSLALLADAGHVAFDSLAIALAWAALQIGRRPKSPSMPYGYARVEVLMAAANAAALLGVAAALALGGYARVQAPQPVDLTTMMGTAALGLCANATSLWLLETCRDNVGVRAAFLHVAGDVLVALAVLVGGAAMRVTGATGLDGWLTLGVAAVLALGAVRLLAEVGRVLLQAAPANLKLAEVHAAVGAVAGVDAVLQLQVWSLTPSVHVLDCHVRHRAEAGVPATAVGEAVAEACRIQFGLIHSTVQVHPATSGAAGRAPAP